MDCRDTRSRRKGPQRVGMETLEVAGEECKAGTIRIAVLSSDPKPHLIDGRFEGVATFDWFLET